jgi:hypothetical protein
VEAVVALTRGLDREGVISAVRRWFVDGHWEGLHPDPRTAPPTGVVKCTYLRWVVGDGREPGEGAPHLNVRMPFELRSTLVRLRVGTHRLRVETGRHAGLARARRTCTNCAFGAVDDLLHFLCECPAFDELRALHPAFAGAPEPAAILHHQDQLGLARVLLLMTEKHDG